MAITYKILGQTMAAATNAETVLYTAGQYVSGASAVVSTITICNQLSTAASYTIAVRPSTTGSTLPQNRIAYNAPIAGTDTTALTIGVSLAPGDKIIVSGSTTTLSFSAFGTEIL
jgi:hypothetical protein